MGGWWSAIGGPIAQGNDVFTVMPGTLAEDELARRLADADAAAVMKLGRNLAKVRRALERAGRLGPAMYVGRGTMADAVGMRLADQPGGRAAHLPPPLAAGREGRPRAVAPPRSAPG